MLPFTKNSKENKPTTHFLQHIDKTQKAARSGDRNAQRELAQTELALADLQASQVLVTWRLALTTLGVQAALGPEALTAGRP